MNRRMHRDRLNIGAYILQPYARTEAHIRDLAAAGVDFVVCMENDRAALDLFHKYGVGAIVTGVVPGWWGGDGHNAGKLADTNPLEKYDAAAESFVDHPAIWGIDVGDEPSALDFPYYGKVIHRVEKCFPNQFAYLNLYPNYASVSQNNATETVNQLGTPTYAEHIERYCENIPAEYICYDFYVYSSSVPRHYENLRIVADACLRTGRQMWIVLQVNSRDEAKWICENELRFQAYTAMTFGAENIIWACYTAGWWHNQVVDANGNKTEQYDKLTKINKELHTIGAEYMRYRRVSTHFVGFENSEFMTNVQQKSVDTLSTGVFQSVHAEGKPLLVGEMVSRTNDGSFALWLCAADDPYDRENHAYTVHISVQEGIQLIAYTGHGKLPIARAEDGTYTLTMHSNEGVLLIATR